MGNHSHNEYMLDHVLSAGDNLVLVLYTDNTEKEGEVDLFFFRIVRAQVFDLQYVEELDEISSGSETEWFKPTKEGSGEDADAYFDKLVEGLPYRIVHFSIGVGPEKYTDIRVYRKVGGKEWQVFFREKGIQKPDYITPLLSPYSRPLSAAEMIIWDEFTPTFNIVNKEQDVIHPALRFLGAIYDIMPITKEEKINKMIAGIIPRRIECVGGVSRIRPNYPDKWGSPYRLTIEKLNEVI